MAAPLAAELAREFGVDLTRSSELQERLKVQADASKGQHQTAPLHLDHAPLATLQEHMPQRSTRDQELGVFRQRRLLLMKQADDIRAQYEGFNLSMAMEDVDKQQSAATAQAMAESERVSNQASLRAMRLREDFRGRVLHHGVSLDAHA